MGGAFSYSVLCSEYVELASFQWNVLLCREAEDAEATRCGSNPGLSRYANGTLSLAEDTGNGEGAHGRAFHLDTYANYSVPAAQLAATNAARVPVVRSLLDGMLAASRLHAPDAADELRRQLSHVWPETSWNVLVELRAGGHFYYSEEQFNFDLRGAGAEALSVAVFDRRCDTLERDSMFTEAEEGAVEAEAEAARRWQMLAEQEHAREKQAEHREHGHESQHGEARQPQEPSRPRAPAGHEYDAAARPLPVGDIPVERRARLREWSRHHQL